MDQRPTHVQPPQPRHQVDWPKFTREMEANILSRPVQTPEEVEKCTGELTKCIQSALETASRPPNPNSRRLPPLPSHISKLLGEKRRVRKLWQRNRDPALKTLLNHLCEEVKAELQTQESLEWEKRLESAADDWSSIHRLCRQLNNTSNPVRPLLHQDGTPRYRAEDRAQIFAEHLEKQFQPNPDYLPEHTAAIEKFVESHSSKGPAKEDRAIFFSPSQVRRAILRTKPRKAPGADRITNAALRHLPFKAVAAVSRLFNGILRCGHFPDDWKLGHVILLPKPGKNVLKPESYRPITLLSCISKLFERLILQELLPHTNPRPEQFGFRPEHSTTLQLTRVLHHLTVTANKKEKAVAVFLDMEKAFDRVWHAGLLFKLANLSTPRPVYDVIASFLEGRRFRVAVEGHLSPEHPIKAGVPQGSCLSPFCYSVYTDDIPTGLDGAMLALYADDAAYITTSMKANHAAVKMQRTLDVLPDWLKKWRLSVNVAKTQAICTTMTKRTLPPSLSLQGQKIKWTGTAKYLGITIDQQLTMRAHSAKVVNLVRVARNLLNPVLKSSLPLRVKVGIYKTYIRPRLTYAAPAWFGLLAESNKKRLRAQQHLALRSIVDAPRHVRNSTIQRDLRIESLDQFAARLSAAMFFRTEQSSHQHLKEIAPTHERDPRGKAYPRELTAAVVQSDPDPSELIDHRHQHRAQVSQQAPVQGVTHGGRTRTRADPQGPWANPRTLS